MDNKSVGTTYADGTLVIEGVEPGTHLVHVEVDGVIQGPVKTDFDPDINKLPAFRTITYAIDTNVPEAEVFVNDKLRGTMDLDGRMPLTLVFGQTYSLKVAKEGYKEGRLTILANDIKNHARIPLSPLTSEGSSASGARQPIGEPVSARVLTAVAGLVVAGGLVLVILLRNPGLGKRADSTGGQEQISRPIPFDKYRISATIGHGGVATIYRATDVTTGSPVALKMLDAKWMADPEMVQKFLSEADALRAVRKCDASAAVVRILEGGREGGRLDGRPFLALELLEGVTLEERLERGVLREAEASAIGFQIARALESVHRAGIVHRDLTPDNIFLRSGHAVTTGSALQRLPRVVLIDFGVARLEFLSRRTMDGSIAGKPAYMSPEQCRGSNVDFRSDLYALGLILYAVVNGKPPFGGQNPFDVMSAHLNATPATLDGKASVAYAALVTELLAKKPEERPASAALVAERLKRIFLTNNRRAANRSAERST